MYLLGVFMQETCFGAFLTIYRAVFKYVFHLEYVKHVFVKENLYTVRHIAKKKVLNHILMSHVSSV